MVSGLQRVLASQVNKFWCSYLNFVPFCDLGVPLQAASTTVYCCAKPHLWDTGHGKFFENSRASRAPAVLCDQTFGAHLWHKTEELLRNVQIDSHQPIDYNVGRAIFMRFWDIFLKPFLQRLGLLRAAEKNM